MRHAALGVVSSLIILSGCGIRPDSTPHNVPEDDQAAFSGRSIGTDTSGADRIYLVEPGEDQLLRSVQRQAASAQELMEALIIGPSDTELDEEYSTAVPSTLTQRWPCLNANASCNRTGRPRRQRPSGR